MSDDYIILPDDDDTDGAGTFTMPENGEDELVDIEFEDGTSGSYAIIVKFEIEGHDCTYAALAPAEIDDDSDELEILVYRYSEKNGEVILDAIDDDAELDEVTTVLDEIIDNAEFNSEDE